MADALPAFDHDNLERLELHFVAHPLDDALQRAMADTDAGIHEALLVALFELERIAERHGLPGAWLLRAAADDRDAFRAEVDAAHDAGDELDEIVRRRRAKGARDDGLNDGG